MTNNSTARRILALGLLLSFLLLSAALLPPQASSSTSGEEHATHGAGTAVGLPQPTGLEALEMTYTVPGPRAGGAQAEKRLALISTGPEPPGPLADTSSATALSVWDTCCGRLCCLLISDFIHAQDGML